MESSKGLKRYKNKRIISLIKLNIDNVILLNPLFKISLKVKIFLIVYLKSKIIQLKRNNNE
jgi:hypothetical protein